MSFEMSRQEIDDEIEDLKFEIDDLANKMQPIHIKYCAGILDGLTPEKAYQQARGSFKGDQVTGWEYIQELTSVKKYVRYSKRLMALECREYTYGQRDWKRRTLVNMVEYCARAANIIAGDKIKPEESLQEIVQRFDARSAIAAMGELNKIDGEYRQAAKEGESAKTVQGLVDRILNERDAS